MMINPRVFRRRRRSAVIPQVPGATQAGSGFIPKPSPGHLAGEPVIPGRKGAVVPSNPVAQAAQQVAAAQEIAQPQRDETPSSPAPIAQQESTPAPPEQDWGGMRRSNLPKGATLSPKGDLGKWRQMEARAAGRNFKKMGPMVLASKYFQTKGMQLPK